MQSIRRFGRVKLDGANPMALIDDDGEPLAPWTPEEERIAHIVGNSIKAYMEAASVFLDGRLQHLRDLVPEHVANPGSYLIAVCEDGIVVRYEKKSSEESKRVIAVIRKPISAVAALLSQKLVHIASTEAPYPLEESFGVELKLVAHSPSQGSTQDISASRIWLQVAQPTSWPPLPTGAKPYCLLSTRNEFTIEIHGALAGNETGEQPFVARSKLRLGAGWDCIEVFPGLDLAPWMPESAALWAENDLLGAALVAQTQEAHLNSLDPRASTRRLYAALLAQFKALLDSNPEREQTLQTFLQSNPVLLCPAQVRMWPKLPLGAHITDFVFREANHEYLLVELERSTLNLFRQDGHATADLTHAQGQIVDWKRYLEDNLQTVQREQGLAGITPNPNGLLVIGRSASLSPQDRRKLQTMMNESPKLRILTYDDVYSSAQAVFENLLGPMWDAGGSTQIYYPSPSTFKTGSTSEPT